MRTSICISAIFIMLGIMMLSACGGPKVTRTERGARDLTGKWNDTDSQIVAGDLTKLIVGGPWINEFVLANSKKPVVQVADITVQSNGEVINTDIFAKEIRNAMLNSGKIKVRSGARSGDTRNVLKDQDKHASSDTKKKMFQETGSDFILTGSINVQNDQQGRKKDKTYAVDMELRSVQTNEIVWADRVQITKQVDRGLFR